MEYRLLTAHGTLCGERVRNGVRSKFTHDEIVELMFEEIHRGNDPHCELREPYSDSPMGNFRKPVHDPARDY